MSRSILAHHVDTVQATSPPNSCSCHYAQRPVQQHYPARPHSEVCKPCSALRPRPRKLCCRPVRSVPTESSLCGSEFRALLLAQTETAVQLRTALRIWSERVFSSRLRRRRRMMRARLQSGAARLSLGRHSTNQNSIGCCAVYKHCTSSEYEPLEGGVLHSEIDRSCRQL